MKRRDFIALLGGAAAAAWPLAARAQQSAMPVIGFLGGESPDLWANFVRAFQQGLHETGYVEDQNVTIEYRWAEGQYDRLPSLAADLVRHKVAVIHATDTPAALAAKAATSTVPIVFTTGGDPIKLGLVASLRRPGGNVTGVTALSVEVGPKRLELARELFPGATTVALLVNPASPLAATVSKDSQAVADTLGVRLHVLHASTEADFEAAFAAAAQLRAAALVISTADPLFNSHAAQRIAENAPRWPDMNTYSREQRLLQPFPMAVEPLAIVLSWSGWRYVEGRLRLDSEQFRFVGMTASALRRRKACRRRDHTAGDAAMA